jgi:hypothetical protein
MRFVRWLLKNLAAGAVGLWGPGLVVSAIGTALAAIAGLPLPLAVLFFVFLFGAAVTVFGTIAVWRTPSAPPVGGAGHRHIEPPPIVFRRSRSELNERWLEWLQVEVENTGQELLPGAWIESSITSQGKVRMAFSGAREDVELKPGLPIQIPLVIRASERHDDAPIYGVVLPAHKAYVSDLTYLKDHVLRRELPAGQSYRFSLILHYRNNEKAEAAFLVDIPGHEGEALRLWHVVPEDS